MTSAVAPPSSALPSRAHHSRLWYVATIGLVVIVCLAGLFGAVHLYSLYAQSLGPIPTRQHTVEKSSPTEKPKTPKASSGEKAGAAGTASSDDSEDTGEKVGGDRTHAKATTTPGL
jgi:hypothetical protein